MVGQGKEKGKHRESENIICAGTLLGVNSLAISPLFTTHIYGESTINSVDHNIPRLEYKGRIHKFSKRRVG